MAKRKLRTFVNSGPASVRGGSAVDITPPSAPELSIVVVLSGSIELSWTASTDNVGIASYRLERSTDQATWSIVYSGGLLTAVDTGLSPATLYYYRVSAFDTSANQSGFGTVQATTLSLPITNYNPPFPRLGGRFQSAFSSTASLAKLQTEAALVAKNHVFLTSKPRNLSLASGSNLLTLAGFIRDAGEPYTGYKTICSLYTNPVQFDESLVQFDGKLTSEAGVGGNRDWYLRYAGTPNSTVGTAPGNIVQGSKVGKRRPNPSSDTTPDNSTAQPFPSGMRWRQWLARYWAGASNESGDWAANGKGICEPGSQWQSAYSDEMNVGDSFSNPSSADWDDDGVNELRTDPAIKTMIANQFADFYNTWKVLFAHYGILENYVFGNLISLSSPAQPWYQYSQLVNLFQGGLVERVSGYELALGFGDYSASVSSGDTGTGFMGRYWRAMRYTASPKLVMFEHDLDDVKSKAWSAPESGFSDYRWSRYFLCACLLDDGYFAINSDAVLGTVPWLDEYNGGSEVNQSGWLGYPVLSTPPRSAYSNGVWVREFTNGLVVINPYQNGQQTVSLPNPGSSQKWVRLLGSQDAAVNNGADQSNTLTIESHDGLILRRASV